MSKCVLKTTMTCCTPGVSVTLWLASVRPAASSASRVCRAFLDQRHEEFDRLPAAGDGQPAELDRIQRERGVGQRVGGVNGGRQPLTAAAVVLHGRRRHRHAQGRETGHGCRCDLGRHFQRNGVVKHPTAGDAGDVDAIIAGGQHGGGKRNRHRTVLRLGQTAANAGVTAAQR